MVRESLGELRASWYRFVILGIALVLLGAGAMTVAEAATVTTAIVLGYLMLAAGVVEGLFRIVSALAGRFRHWEWMLFNGLVTLALGVMIWRQWPLSGLYVVGLFLGINLVLSGASYISLGLAARKLPV
jgi:uncharacterized membrane protein HdeD (DUF308 family)